MSVNSCLKQVCVPVLWVSKDPGQLIAYLWKNMFVCKTGIVSVLNDR